MIPGVAPPWPGQDAALFLTAIAEILRAIQWPLVALIIAIRFRDDIASLLARLERWEAFGQKWELQKRLSQVEEASERLTPADVGGPTTDAVQVQQSSASQAEQLPLQPMETAVEISDGDMKGWLDANLDRIANAIRHTLNSENDTSLPDSGQNRFNEVEQDILRAASRNPRAALTRVSLALRAAIDEIAESSGNQDLNTSPMAPEMKATELEARGVLSVLAGDAFRKWWMARALLRGQGKTDLDRLRAVDSGLAILAVIQAAFDLPIDVMRLRHDGEPHREEAR